MKLKTRIRELRARDRLSQEELAQRVGVRRQASSCDAHCATLRHRWEGLGAGRRPSAQARDRCRRGIIPQPPKHDLATEFHPLSRHRRPCGGK